MRSRILRPLVALLVVSLLSPDCAAWREVRRTTPTRYLKEHHPGRMRFVLTDSAVVLRNPSAAVGSVEGWTETGNSPAARMSIPEADIRSMSIRGPSTWPMWVAAGVSAGVVVMLIAQGPKDIRTNP